MVVLFVGDVDRNDEMLPTYCSVTENLKIMNWTKKVAFHFIKVAILNTFLPDKKQDNGKHLI